MEEDKIKSILNALDAPEPRKGAQERTADAAWEKLKKNPPKAKSHKGLWGFPAARGFAVACCVVIAVVSVLSYSVTQSSRSGGGSTDGEANLVSSAQITQYPASIRTAIVRMVIGGAAPENLDFTSPEFFDETTNISNAVFHPKGGGATYIKAPATVMANGQEGTWIFNAEFAIEEIGTDENEILALLPGINEETCSRLNTELGISGPIQIHGNTLGGDAFRGQSYGCFQDNDGAYVYFHTLLER